MALHQPATQPTTLDLVRVLLIIAAVIALIAAATIVFGFQVTGPTYEITTDPAGALPF
jgi:hypothetical protein